MSAIAAAQVEIKHEVGLHARPSVKFTKLAKTALPPVARGLDEIKKARFFKRAFNSLQKYSYTFR